MATQVLISLIRALATGTLVRLRQGLQLVELKANRSLEWVGLRTSQQLASLLSHRTSATVLTLAGHLEHHKVAAQDTTSSSSRHHETKS